MINNQSVRTMAHLDKITINQENQRIDNFLISQLKGVPKSRIYRIIRKGEVRVNKKRIKPEYKLQIDDEVRIPPIQTIDHPKPPIDQFLESRIQAVISERILYEDDNLLIINKPSGIPVHGGSGVNAGLIEALRRLRPKDNYLELVHRLDKDTSGCLLVAKKARILKELHQLLKQGEVEKNYLALVHGCWPNCLKLIDLPLKKNICQSGERVVKVSGEGKDSLTAFKVVEEFVQWTLVLASPKTGRTHQIRVHCLAKGFPIVGDKKYGNLELDREIGAKRLFLHAKNIRFKLPSYDQVINIDAPLDTDLDILLQRLRQEDDIY